MKIIAKLSIKDEHGKERVHELIDDVTTVGRASINVIQVSDEKASRQHFRIEKQPGGNSHPAFKVVDLGSANGTRLNGSRIQSDTLLNSGDKISLGKTVFTYESPGAAEEKALSPGKIGGAPVGNDSELISAAEAALLLGVDATEIERLCSQGRLDGFHMGSELQVQRGDLTRLRDAMTTNAQPGNAASLNCVSSQPATPPVAAMNSTAALAAIYCPKCGGEIRGRSFGESVWCGQCYAAFSVADGLKAPPVAPSHEPLPGEQANEPAAQGRKRGLNPLVLVSVAIVVGIIVLWATGVFGWIRENLVVTATFVVFGLVAFIDEFRKKKVSGTKDTDDTRQVESAPARTSPFAIAVGITILLVFVGSVVTVLYIGGSGILALGGLAVDEARSHATREAAEPKYEATVPATGLSPDAARRDREAAEQRATESKRQAELAQERRREEQARKAELAEQRKAEAEAKTAEAQRRAGDEAAKKAEEEVHLAVVQAWLEDQYNGNTGLQYWDPKFRAGGEYLIGVQKWELKSHSRYQNNNRAITKVRVWSTNQGGQPIVKDWNVMLGLKNGKWVIIQIY